MKDMKNFKFYWDSANGPDIRIHVPGFTKDEIKVRLSGKSLQVSAEKRHHKTEKGRGFYREESFSRAFNRFIALPHKINPEEFEVSVSDGEIVLKRKKKIVKKKAGKIEA